MPATLLYDPLRGFRQWHIDQVYMGPGGPEEANVVVNVNDLVIDFEAGMYKVNALDTNTFIPTLELWDPTKNIIGEGNESLITGLSGYQPSILFRAFLDTTVTPYTLTIDDQYVVKGSDANRIKIFLGTNTTGTGQVISQRLNGLGEVIGENIDLEQIDPGNPALKRPMTIYTGENMNDGELVTMVIYTESGVVTGEHTFVVKNSSAIRGVAANTKVIVDVQLVSDLLSETVLDLVQVPANTPITGGDFQAKLIYNDGSEDMIAVDGVKCKVFGLDNFNTSLAGTMGTIVLTYYADPDEPVINMASPILRHISHTYDIQTITNNLDFAFKAYAIPRYVATPTPAFTLDFYLTNVARDILVKLLPGQYTFAKADSNPVELDFMANQTLNFQDVVLRVDMETVFPSTHAGYIFVQTILIDFNNINQNSETWLIDYIGNNSNTYGTDTKFLARNYTYSSYVNPLDMTVFAADQNEWLDKLYHPMQPIFDPETEVGYPLPTHFKLRYATNQESAEIPLADWDVLHERVGATTWTNLETVEVIWLLEVPLTTIKKTLAVTPVMVHLLP